MKSQYIMEKGCLVVYVPRELDHHQANRIRTETDLLNGILFIEKAISLHKGPKDEE